MPETTPAAISPTAVRSVARAAIRQRLTYHVPDAIIGCVDDPEHPGAVLLHVNSGGNALVTFRALRKAGFDVEDVPTVEHGCKMRVTPSEPARA